MVGSPQQAHIKVAVWQRQIQWLLRSGLAVSSTLIVIGLAMAVSHGLVISNAVALSQIFSGATLAERVIALGLVGLAVTPVLRVVALIAIWLTQRDYRFALLGCVVLLVLVASALHGGG